MVGHLPPYQQITFKAMVDRLLLARCKCGFLFQVCSTQVHACPKCLVTNQLSTTPLTEELLNDLKRDHKSRTQTWRGTRGDEASESFAMD